MMWAQTFRCASTLYKGLQRNDTASVHWIFTGKEIKNRKFFEKQKTLKSHTPVRDYSVPTRKWLLWPTILDGSFLTPKHRYAQCAKHHQENKKQSKCHVPKLLNNWTEPSNNFPIRSFTPQRPHPNFWANILFCGLKMVPSHYRWDFHCLSSTKTEQLKDAQTMPQGFLTFFFSFKYEKMKTKPHRLTVYRYWIFFLVPMKN